jgi:hypothetical protein
MYLKIFNEADFRSQKKTLEITYCSKCFFLLQYFIFVLIIFAMEIGAGVIAYIYNDKVSNIQIIRISGQNIKKDIHKTAPKRTGEKLLIETSITGNNNLP